MKIKSTGDAIFLLALSVAGSFVLGFKFGRDSNK